MDVFMIIGSQRAVPEGRWSLKEAQEILEAEYSDHRGANLNFEKDSGADVWTAYDFHNMGPDDHAAQIPEKIVRVEIPENLRVPYRLPEGISAEMEMRVTTRDGITSMRHVESGVVWDAIGTGRGYIVEQFAARAGRALADYVTKGEPR